MNFFKLLLIFALLFFGSFGQRFLRYSNNDALDDEKDSDNLLFSDGSNAQQEGGDVKFTGYVEEIELELDELKFEYCSKRIRQNEQRCMNQRVYACYDAENPHMDSRGYCGVNQCRFAAGISLGERENRLWFMKPEYSTRLDNDKDICATAVMQSPTAQVTPIPSFPTCKPFITNGKIKLSVKEATPDCFLTVKNAKIWTPATTQSPTTQAPPASQATVGSKEETSNATLIWAIVGGILFILLIGIIAFVVWYCCIRKQNKTSEKKMIIVETPKSSFEADVVKEKSEEKPQPVKPKLTTEDTKEKKKAVEKERASKPKKKEKKAEQKTQLKPSKEIAQENVPKKVTPKKIPPKTVQAPAEPTLDDPTTGASITAQENEQPHVSVPKHLIHPAPLQPASKAITLYSRSSSRKGSLSERHEIGMRTMVENPSETCIRRSQGSIDNATNAKLERCQMPVIFAEFSLKERKKLAYPITAIEDAYNMDPDGFKNTSVLDTESGMEEQPTQDSITEKNRKKKSGGGKKKRSKKRH